MSNREHTHPTPEPLAIFSLNRPICLVRLDTELVFTEKDITHYDKSARLVLQS